MALPRLLRSTLAAVVFGLGGAYIATHGEAIINLYEALYPNDPAKRQALDMCFLENHDFNRLDAAQRTACYQHARLSGAFTASIVGVVPANDIDLRQAAAAGTMPRNDVRRAEQTRDAHLVH
jgi:hypothetical protein